MRMGKNGQDLLALIAGRTRPVIKVAHSRDLLDTLRGAVHVKSAQDTLSDSKYTRSIAATQQRRQQEAYDRNHIQRFRQSMLTGNPAYDNLPDNVAARNKAESAYHWNRFADSRKNVAKLKSKADIAREIDAEGGVADFGSTGVGRAIGRGLDVIGRGVDAVGKGIGYAFSAPKGTTWKDWSKQYDSVANQGRDSLHHDMANNMQLQWNKFKRGAGDVGRFAAKWGDPRSWGNSTAARLNRRDHDNKWDNAVARTEAIEDRIVGNFHDSTLRNTDSGLGKWNRKGNAAIGTLAGGTVATAGVGGLAKGLGAGAQAVVNGVGSGLGRAATGLVNATARAVNVGQASGRAGRVATGVGNVVNNVVRGAGEVITVPLNTVGTLSNPVAGARKAISTVAQPTKQIVGSAARGVYDTAKATLRPAGDLMHVLRHPVQNARLAGAYMRHMPGYSAAQAGRYAMNYGKNVIGTAARSTYNLGKPIVTNGGKLLFSKPVMAGQQLYDSGISARGGNYGGAVGGMGSHGLYNLGGMAGRIVTPALFGYNMYSGVRDAMSGGGGAEYGGY